MASRIKYIYKILSLSEWNEATTTNRIITELDKKDGFIHLSTAKQLSATLALYFSNDQEVMLLRILSKSLKDNLIYEAPDSQKRSGQFPHYYGKLKKNHVEKTWLLKRSAFEVPNNILLEAEAE